VPGDIGTNDRSSENTTVYKQIANVICSNVMAGKSKVDTSRTASSAEEEDLSETDRPWLNRPWRQVRPRAITTPFSEYSSSSAGE